MYINKIIELLQKYINDYEAKKYELEVLKTKKQLYEELIPLLENKTELNDNKLFISVLLSSIYNNEEYKTSDRLKYKFILFSPKINDEVKMYVNKKNPNITVSPWNTFLYKFYFNLIIICILIPFIIYNLK